MSDTLERLGTSEVRIQVRIPWTEMETSYNESLSKVRSTIQVRGFRPGKAPRSMIEKMVGDGLLREVAADHVGRRVQEMIRRERIMPLRPPIGIEDKIEVGEDREARFEARIEVLPMIGKIGFENLEITPRREVDDAQVHERIHLIAARKAPLESAPKDHAISEYDQVVLNGKATFKDEESEQQDVKDLRVDLAPWSDPPPNLLEQLKGKRVGEKVEVDLVLPRPQEQGGPRYAHLSCEVSEIVTRRVPEIDDDLAKDFDMESLGELENMVRDALEKEALDEHVASNGDAILEQLLDRISFDIPPSYRAFQDAVGGASSGGEEDEKAKEQRERIGEFYDRYARRSLLSMIIAHQNGLQLPEEAVQKASEEMRDAIDAQEGSQEEKDRAFDQWRSEFEQGLFNKVISSFLLQEAEKGMEETDAGEGVEDGSRDEDTKETEER